ncbi:MAG: hypothetical protein J7M03_04360 [Candidatus Desulfofervidaceae bacterium]|nr:hypothetical protein [Candidatus Desulfofervidaceae bacterium]
MKLWFVAIMVFILNLPFGYWRASTKKFSSQWFLSVHIPVPFVIAFRVFSGLGWRFITFPILIGAFFSGQLIGGKVYRWRINNGRKSEISIITPKHKN